MKYITNEIYRASASLLLLSLFFLFPASAFALPTPDVLVSLVNIVPILTGTIAAFAGGFYLALGRLLGPIGSKIALASFAFFIVTLLTGAYWYHETQRLNRINQIAVYLRCSPSSHEFSRNWNITTKKPDESSRIWLKYGHFVRTEMGNLRYLLRKQPDAKLLDTSSREIQFHSGFPGVRLGKTIKPFEHVRASELSKILKKSTAKDLYLYDFSYINHDPDKFIWDKSVFAKFDNIYLVRGIKKDHRFIIDKYGNYLPAQSIRSIEWPVEEERWILNEDVIKFPNITTLLSDKKAASYLNQDNIFLVAPFGTYRRSEYVHNRIYLNRLLRDVDKSRILSVNMTAEKTSERLAEIAKIIDGKPFIVIGWAKHDWLYEGLDCTYALWKKLDSNPKRFKLLGFNTRLPEVVAISWEKKLSKGFIESLREPFWYGMKFLHQETTIGYGTLVFITAIFLRFLLFPIGLLESCSRVKRKYIHLLCKQANPPAWVSSADSLIDSMKVSNMWEIIGGLVTLLLILPAYSILSQPLKSIPVMEFLWINDLLKPDIPGSLLAGVIIYLKLKLSPGVDNQWWKLLVAILFTIILIYLPSILTVYLLGVLSITLVQDIIALNNGKRLLKRALLT